MVLVWEAAGGGEGVRDIESKTRIPQKIWGKTRSVLAQTPMSLSAVPMDARTCHFHRTVGYLENGCRKIMKNPNFKSNDDGDEEDDDDNDGDNNETLRRGCCVKKLTRHMVRIPFEG